MYSAKYLWREPVRLSLYSSHPFWQHSTCGTLRYSHAAAFASLAQMSSDLSIFPSDSHRFNEEISSSGYDRLKTASFLPNPTRLEEVPAGFFHTNQNIPKREDFLPLQQEEDLRVSVLSRVGHKHCACSIKSFASYLSSMRLPKKCDLIHVNSR